MSKQYKNQHEKRMKITISELSGYVTGKEKTLNIGVSDIDIMLLSFFQNLYFAVPSNLYSSQDEIKRNIIQLDIIDKEIETKEKFDIIIFTEVLEHLMADDESVIKNLYNLLHNQGILIFSVPNAVTLLNRFKIIFGQNIYWDKSDIIKGVYGGFGHIREYTFSEVQRLLSIHFDILLIKGINGYRNGIKRIINLLPKTFSNTIFVICRKKPEVAIENKNVEKLEICQNKKDITYK